MAPSSGTCTEREDDRLSAIARRLGARRARLVVASRDELAAALGVREEEVVAVLGGRPVSVADLRSLARERVVGRPLVADVTEATTHGCPAVRLGADVAVASAGEGLWLVAEGVRAEEASPGLGARLAALPTPSSARLATFLANDAEAAVMWRLTSDAAAVVARYLVCHPAVARVRYPGLRDDPSFEVAARTLVGGFGARVSYASAAEPGTWANVLATADDPREQVMALEARLRDQ